MVTLAALFNALEIAGKRIETVKIVLVGIGAANMAVYALLKAAGHDTTRLIALDTGGTLHRGRLDIEARKEEFREKWQVCQETNVASTRGGIREALEDADVCIAFSTPGPHTIASDAVAGMARDAIVFACANPVPEIWPDEARRAGARIVATGRGDFANQVNNSLVFPGMFRGVLDARARRITDTMALAAASALAAHSRRGGIHETRILCLMDDMEAAAEIAATVAVEAARAGVADVAADHEYFKTRALEKIRSARELNQMAAAQWSSRSRP